MAISDQDWLRILDNRRHRMLDNAIKDMSHQFKPLHGKFDRFDGILSNQHMTHEPPFFKELLPGSYMREGPFFISRKKHGPRGPFLAQG